MARYKHIDTNPRFLPVNLARKLSSQPRPATSTGNLGLLMPMLDRRRPSHAINPRSRLPTPPRPVGVKVRAARPVNTLILVRAEEIALGLQQIGG